MKNNKILGIINRIVRFIASHHELMFKATPKFMVRIIFDVH